MTTITNNTDICNDTTRLKLFNHLWRGGSYSYFWTPSVSQWFEVENIPAVPQVEKNLYFGIHPVTSIPQTNTKGIEQEPRFVRSQNAYIAAINALFGEYDIKDFGSDKAILEHIETLISPSVIVFSGGGYHCYWLLDTPFSIDNDLHRERAKQAQYNWVDFVGSDSDAKDLSRILRIPGTVNCKYDSRPQVEIVKADFDLLYTLDFLEKQSYKKTSSISPNGNNKIHTSDDIQIAEGCLSRLRQYRCEEYQQWVNVGMALSSLGSDGLRLWDEWSQNSEKYEPGICHEKWETFEPNSGLSFGSLVHWANEDDPFTTSKNVLDELDLTGLKPVNEPEELLPEYPALPVEFYTDYQNSWLEHYLTFARSVSPMTPDLFHESAGLWLVSVAIARRLRVSMHYGNVYPNLFVVWIANTTLYRKSTAMKEARKIARRLFPYLLSPQDATPEAILADMAGREPVNLSDLNDIDKEDWKQSRNFSAQKGWVLDELSSLVSSAGKDYNSGLLEQIMRLYDCDSYFKRSTRTGGITIVKNAYLSILGASTPSALASHLKNDKMWSMGFWPRFAVLTPSQRPDWKSPAIMDEPPQLAQQLEDLLERLPSPIWPNPVEPLNVNFASDDIYHLWQRYNKAVSYDLLTDGLDRKLFGTYGRLPSQVIKIAIIFAALDWSDTPAPVIKECHLLQAISIAEKWRASAHRAIVMAGKTEFSEDTERVLRAITRFKEGGTARNIVRALGSNMKTRQVKDHIEELLERGEIEAVTSTTDNNREVIKYRIKRA